jgi:hypothetical protein
MESKDLWVDLRLDQPSHMVLRGTYGQRIHREFGVSRQGVRWRFDRLFNDVYVSAFETILFIEKTFGTDLRQHAIRISQERYNLRQRMPQMGFQSAAELASRREPTASVAESDPQQMTRDSPSVMPSAAPRRDDPEPTPGDATNVP